MCSFKEKKNYNMDGGKIAELKVQKYFKDLGYAIEDTSKDSYYWDKDIDMLVKKGDKEFKIEVKQDNLISTSHNILVEDFRKNDGHKGWLHKTEADFIFFVGNKDTYITKPEELRKYYAKYKEDKKKIRIYIQKDPLKNGGNHFYVNGLIKEEEYKKEGNFVRKVYLN